MSAILARFRDLWNRGLVSFRVKLIAGVSALIIFVTLGFLVLVSDAQQSSLETEITLEIARLAESLEQFLSPVLLEGDELRMIELMEAHNKVGDIRVVALVDTTGELCYSTRRRFFDGFLETEVFRHYLESAARNGVQNLRLRDRHGHQILRFLRRRPRVIPVYPRILFPDVGHLEQMRIQPGSPKRLLEQRLVRARRARGHHHPIQSILLNPLPNALLGVLRTGVQIVLGEDYSRQTGSIVDHLRNLHHTPNVDPTMTDKDAYPCILLAHVPLRWIYDLLHL